MVSLVRFLQIFIYFSLFIDCNSSGNVTRKKRIVNGIRVEGAAPFIASLQILENSDFVHFCTGTYLGQGFVLTASHCLKFIKICDIHVQIGETKITKDNNRSRYNVTSSCRKQYDIYTYNNDIALLKLNMSKDDPFYNTEYIKIPATYRIDVERCKIYGFGATRYAGRHSEHLLNGIVKLIRRKACVAILGNVITPDYHMGMFCARGNRGVDACSGDSGGGLFCKEANKSADTYLIGLVSYGMGCGSEAGVYTSAIHHVRWIDTTIKLMADND